MQSDAAPLKNKPNIVPFQQKKALWMISATQNQLRTSFGRRGSFAPPLSTWFANSFTLLLFQNQYQDEEIVFRSMKCALCPPFSTWPTWPARKLSMRTPTCGTQMIMKTTSGTLRLRTRTISTLAIQIRNPQAPQRIIRLSEFCRSSCSLSWNKIRLEIVCSDNSKQVFQNAFSRYKPVSIYSLHHEHEQRNG